MALFHYTHDTSGFTDLKPLMHDVVNKMKDNGFSVEFPAVVTGSENVVILKAGPTVDPLSSTQPWIIRFEFLDATDQLMVIVGTSYHIDTSTGAYTKYTLNTRNVLILGLVGVDKPTGDETTYVHEHFFDRRAYEHTVSSSDAYPMNYSITIGTVDENKNGFALAIWEPGLDDNIDRQSWMVVQRPVMCTDGKTIVTGKSPVFCIYGIQRGQDYRLTATDDDSTPTYTQTNEKNAVRVVRKFTVRELDVLRPTRNVDATTYGEDTRPSVPGHEVSLVSFLEDGTYNVDVIGGLNTQRFNYPLYELDLMAYTSADVVATSNTINLSMYGETNPRTYRSLNSTGIHNSNVRMLIRCTPPVVTP